jgi:predicted phage-related endonuclease
MSLFSLWMVKSGRLEAPDVTGERPAWGRRLEDVIGEACAEEYGWMLRRGEWVQDMKSRLAATTDFYRIIDNRISEVVEIKNTDWIVHRNQWTEDQPPVHVQVQLQAQLACTGLYTGHVVALVGGNHLTPYEFERDERLIADMRARAVDFWQSIDENRPPPVDGSASTHATLGRLWPEAVLGKPYDTEDDPEFHRLCEELRDIAPVRLEAEKAEKQIKNDLLARMGDCEVAVYDGRVLATCPTVKRAGYSVKASSYRQFKLKD